MMTSGQQAKYSYFLDKLFVPNLKVNGLFLSIKEKSCYASGNSYNNHDHF